MATIVKGKELTNKKDKRRKRARIPKALIYEMRKGFSKKTLVNCRF